MKLLNSTHARALTLVLLLQIVAFYALASRKELEPNPRPLSEFPSIIGSWEQAAEFPMEKEVQEVLRADDTVNRTYVDRTARTAANMFVAFFKTQRRGQSPHSPKNCLPAAGWEPSAVGAIDVDVTGKAPRRISINRYIVSRGNDKSVVLYWYQSHGRVIADELSAKLWLVADAIRYRRSDTALVRVTVPILGRDDQAVVGTAVAFVQALYPVIENHLGE
jgi:EpsI family protein